MTESQLENLLTRIRSCDVCARHLPLGPRPTLRASATARILIVGQAPGTKVHETGIPWNDASGRRLRGWLALDDAFFYDESRIAIMPMGFCYPGRDPKGGDAPPRTECAPLWHNDVLKLMPRIELTLLVGSYAQAHYLGKQRKKTMTETVEAWSEYRPFFPLPHPSWRTGFWEKRNPWFETKVIPKLRRAVSKALGKRVSVPTDRQAAGAVR